MLETISPPKGLRTTSCGCCTHGCVCWNHRDEPRGLFVATCTYHQAVAHPRTTSPIEGRDLTIRHEEETR